MNAMQARGLRVRLDGRMVLHGLDIAVPAGRWLAVVGPNGAGKSTLLRALAGLQPFDGEVRLQGELLDHWPRQARARTLAWLGQGQQASGELTAYDVVMLGRLPHQGWQAQATAADHAAVTAALEATDALAWRHRALGTLSGGECQRVLLARALAVEAPVLLMDEPLAHLDAPHQAHWWQLVRRLVAQGRTVVSVLHELSVALQADSLLLLDQGRVHHQGSPQDAATRHAVESLFGHSLAVRQVDGQWVALPRLGGPNS